MPKDMFGLSSLSSLRCPALFDALTLCGLHKQARSLA
jgi:hypothetical protein